MCEGIRIASNYDPEDLSAEEAAKAVLEPLVWRINFKITGYSGKRECPICNCERVGPPRSWIAFFRVVTDKRQIKELDRWIRDQIYEVIYSRYKVRLGRNDLRRAGLRSLVSECYRAKKTRRKPCICDLKRDGIAPYLKDLYEGCYFRTLAKHEPFRVSAVSSTSLYIQKDRTELELPQEHLINSWERLRSQGRITRAEIEDSGFWMSSRIVALLSILPGVQVISENPIQLVYTEQDAP